MTTDDFDRQVEEAQADLDEAAQEINDIRILVMGDDQ